MMFDFDKNAMHKGVIRSIVQDYEQILLDTQSGGFGKHACKRPGSKMVYVFYCSNYYATDTWAAVWIGLMTCGTMFPMSVYSGKILLQVSISDLFIQDQQLTICDIFLQLLYLNSGSSPIEVKGAVNFFYGSDSIIQEHSSLLP